MEFLVETEATVIASRCNYQQDYLVHLRAKKDKIVPVNVPLTVKVLRRVCRQPLNCVVNYLLSLGARPA
jgi:hypothetical protein